MVKHHGVTRRYVVKGAYFYKCEGVRIMWRLVDEVGVPFEVLSHSEFKVVGVILPKK